MHLVPLRFVHFQSSLFKYFFDLSDVVKRLRWRNKRRVCDVHQILSYHTRDKELRYKKESYVPKQGIIVSYIYIYIYRQRDVFTRQMKKNPFDNPLDQHTFGKSSVEEHTIHGRELKNILCEKNVISILLDVNSVRKIGIPSANQLKDDQTSASARDLTNGAPKESAE